jgi:hypothetical protein
MISGTLNVRKLLMKKVVFFILLISPIVLHAQLFVNLGAGAATYEQKLPLTDEGSHALPSQVLVPVVKMAAGFEMHRIFLEAELRPTLTHESNSPNNLGLKAGYYINHFIPAIGYYYNYCNSDNPINNKAGFGYSVEYIVPFNRNGDLYFEAVYLNNSWQLTGGFHIPFER